MFLLTKIKKEIYNSGANSTFGPTKNGAISPIRSTRPWAELSFGARSTFEITPLWSNKDSSLHQQTSYLICKLIGLLELAIRTYNLIYQTFKISN